MGPQTRFQAAMPEAGRSNRTCGYPRPIVSGRVEQDSINVQLGAAAVAHDALPYASDSSDPNAMIPELRNLTRYLAVMTLLIVALGTFLRLATRCELSVLRSLKLHDIVSCAMLRSEDEK